jgi:(2Fe-2S) ferredoxin
MKQFKLAAKKNGIDDVRVQKSGCLDFCESGPTCVIYPNGDWFRITEEAIPSLVSFLDGGVLPSEFILDLKV